MSNPCRLVNGELMSRVSALLVRLSKIRLRSACCRPSWHRSGLAHLGGEGGRTGHRRQGHDVCFTPTECQPLPCSRVLTWLLFHFSVFCEQMKESAQRKVVCQELTSL